MLKNIEQIEAAVAAAKGMVLLLLSESELQELRTKTELPLSCEDTTLSMLHLRVASAAADVLHGTAASNAVLAVTPQQEVTSASERALIYAMLVRCRKVISCRDKLEDMLKYDDRAGWQFYKDEYENKVLDLFKATWRDAVIYPYNIIDNISKYNKQESYILKALYNHLSERTPGRINDGDVQMTCELRQMFSDIGAALCRPKLVLVGDVASAAELTALADYYAAQPDVSVLAVK